mgnify:CR=1 FL=1
MAKVFVLREGFLDRVRKMSGLKSEEAFAGALHVSLEELQTAERLRNPSPNVLVGLFEHSVLRRVRQPLWRSR